MINRQVYAKDGVTFTKGQNFIFTGEGEGEVWEIDKPTAGNRAHGIVVDDGNEGGIYNALFLVAGPIKVRISATLAKFDPITPDGSGDFKKKGAGDVLVGQVLKAGNSGDKVPAGFSYV